MSEEFKNLALELGFNVEEAEELFDALEKHHPKRAKKGTPLKNYVDDDNLVIVFSQTDPVPRVNLLVSLKLISFYWNETLAQEDPRNPFIDGTYYKAYSILEMPEKIYNENPVYPNHHLDGHQKDSEYQFDFSKVSHKRKALVKMAIVAELLDNSNRQKRGEIIKNFFMVSDKKFNDEFKFQFARIYQKYENDSKYKSENYLILNKKGNVSESNTDTIRDLNLSDFSHKRETKETNVVNNVINISNSSGGNYVAQNVKNSSINIMDYTTLIKVELANNNTKKAIEFLLEAATKKNDNNFMNDAINISSRYNRYCDEKNNGTTSNDDLKTELNKINAAIIHYADDI